MAVPAASFSLCVWTVRDKHLSVQTMRRMERQEPTQRLADTISVGGEYGRGDSTGPVAGILAIERERRGAAIRGYFACEAATCGPTS